MPIGNCALSTLEVNPDAGTTRDPDDYIDKRSAEERSGCHGREFLQLSRRTAADEAGRAARGVTSDNSTAHSAPSGSGAFWLLHLFRGETGAGAGGGRTFLFEKFNCASAGKEISALMSS